MNFEERLAYAADYLPVEARPLLDIARAAHALARGPAHPDHDGECDPYMEALQDSINEFLRDRAPRQFSYYIATTLGNAAAHNRLRDLLAARGHYLTYDWTAHGSVADRTPEERAEVATEELSGVECADVVFVLLPGGAGTHTEMGAALVCGARVILVATPEEAERVVFYRHPLVTRAGTLEEAAAQAEE